MPETSEIRVVQRNLRWEVRAHGAARPMIDWLCTKERAVEHARERAHEVGAKYVVVEASDGRIDEVIGVDAPFARYELVA
jgi:hypothetical protein